MTTVPAVDRAASLNVEAPNTAAPDVELPDAVADARVRPAPVKKAPVRRTRPEVPDVPGRVQLAPVAEPRGTAAAGEVPPLTVSPTRRPADPLVRILTTLAVVLLVVAAALGAAALVESQRETYRATCVVQLKAGPAPTVSTTDSLRAGAARYAMLATSRAFTTQALAQAQLGSGVARTDVQAAGTGGPQLTLTVQATTSRNARALARGAAAALVNLVQQDQTASVTSEGDRLSAEVVSAASPPRKTAPSRSRAVLAALLAAVVVVVLAGVAVVLCRPRRRAF